MANAAACSLSSSIPYAQVMHRCWALAACCPATCHAAQPCVHPPSPQAASFKSPRLPALAATRTLPWMPNHATSLATLSYAPGQPWEFCPRSGGFTWVHALLLVTSGAACAAAAISTAGCIAAASQSSTVYGANICRERSTLPVLHSLALLLAHLSVLRSSEAGAGACAGAAWADHPARIW